MNNFRCYVHGIPLDAAGCCSICQCSYGEVRVSKYDTTMAELAAKVKELEQENAGLKRGQKLLVHLHGLLSTEVIGYPVLESIEPTKEKHSERYVENGRDAVSEFVDGILGK